MLLASYLQVESKRVAQSRRSASGKRARANIVCKTGTLHTKLGNKAKQLDNEWKIYIRQTSQDTDYCVCTVRTHYLATALQQAPRVINSGSTIWMQDATCTQHQSVVIIPFWRILGQNWAVVLNIGSSCTNTIMVVGTIIPNRLPNKLKEMQYADTVKSDRMMSRRKHYCSQPIRMMLILGHQSFLATAMAARHDAVVSTSNSEELFAWPRESVPFSYQWL